MSDQRQSATSGQRGRQGRWGRRLVLGAAGVVAFIGVAVLVGWATGSEAIVRVIPGLPPMAPNTAIGLFFLATALWLQRAPRQPVRRARAIAVTLALATSLIGTLTLFQRVANIDFGLEHVFDLSRIPALTAEHGRMAPLTAAEMVVLGLAAAWLDAGSRRARAWSAGLALGGFLLSYAILVGYLLQLGPNSDPLGLSMIAVHTALCLALLAIALVFANPSVGALALMSHPSGHAAMARWFLLWAFAVPLALGIAEHMLRTSGVYGVDLGDAITVTVTSSLLGFGVLVNARTAQQRDEQGHRARGDEHFLFELSDALRASPSSAATIATCVERLGARLGATRCNLSEVDAQRDVVTVHPEYLVAGPSMAGTIPVLGATEANMEASLGGVTMVYTNTRTDPRTAQRYDSFYAPRGLVSFIAVPLVRDAGWSGTLMVAEAHERLWTEHEVALVQAVAERVWVWLEHLRMVERLRDNEAELRRLNETLEARVTERTRELSGAQERLEKSLREKEVLLKEIHHRVKNNLQVVASLLSLQAHRLSDPAAREMLSESQARVYAMALIHEKLYRSQDLASVDFAPFAQALVASLAANHDAAARGITTDVTAHAMTLPVDIASPLGLIATELVTNVLKHAFPRPAPAASPPEAPLTGGRITVRLAAIGAGELELTVSDDGVGMPAGFDARTASSLGLDLVYTFAEQLGATVDVGPLRPWPAGAPRPPRPGTAFVVRFAATPPDAAPPPR